MVLRQVIIIITDKRHISEEIQQLPHFWDVVHQGLKVCTNPIPSWGVPKYCGRHQENIGEVLQRFKQGRTSLHQGSSIMDDGITKGGGVPQEKIWKIIWAAQETPIWKRPRGSPQSTIQRKSGHHLIRQGRKYQVLKQGKQKQFLKQEYEFN